MLRTINRILFSDCENYMRVVGVRRGAIMNIGIDNLREINAMHGIQVGDRIIRKFSELLVAEVGEQYLFRLGNSDEFILILPEYRSEWEGRGLFARLQKQIREQCREEKFYYTISAGMVFFEEIGSDLEDLFSCAEFALNRAKDNGKNMLFVYSTSEVAAYRRRTELYHALQFAVENQFQGFELYYQPIVSMEEQRLAGAEALLRWKHPDYPGISPAEFIPLMEQTGLINPVGAFIIEHAMAQQAEWETLLPGFCMHLNLSYVQFQTGNLVDILRKNLKKYGVKAQNIALEITESGFLGKNDQVLLQLQQCKQLGFQLALDDFGTGYSNFSCLKDFELDKVKLDREFIRSAIREEEGMRLLVQIVNTIHAMGMKVCLEGVERPEDLERFLPCQPELIQGYIFGKPVDAESFPGYFEGVDHQQYLSRARIPQKAGAETERTEKKQKKRDGADRKKRTRKERYKPFLILILILLALFVVIGVFYGNASSEMLRGLLHDNMQEHLDVTLRIMDSRVNEAFAVAENLAVYEKQSLDSFAEDGNLSMIQALLKDHANVAGTGVWFEPEVFAGKERFCQYVYRKDGRLVETDVYGTSEYDYFSQEYYTRAKEERQPIITMPYFDENMACDLITFAYPIFDENDSFIGCVTADFFVLDFERVLEELRPEAGGYVILLNGQGEYICGFGSRVSRESFRQSYDSYLQADSQVGDRLRKNESGNYIYTLDGQQYDVYYDTMQETGWKLVLCADYGKLYEPVRDARYSMLSLIIAVLAVTTSALVLVWMLMRRQNALDSERERNINQSQFKALRTTYYFICSVQIDTEKLDVIYRSPEFALKIQSGERFGSLTDEIGELICEEDRETFYHLMSRENLLRAIRQNGVLCDEVRCRIPGRPGVPEWAEVSVSPVAGSGNKEVLIMIRDIDQFRQKIQAAVEENHALVEKLKLSNEELFRSSITDSLTGVYNRLGLEYYRETILKAAETSGNQLFVLLADMDRLKTVNDAYGHAAGDRYISLVASILQETASRWDPMICVRIGGDEFVLFGSISESEDPDQILAALEAKVEECRRREAVPWQIGISMGYYCGKPDGNQDFDYYTGIADRKMYQMKHNRRREQEEDQQPY